MTGALILLWLIVFILFWPLALLTLLLIPIFWLLSIPFRIVYWVVEATLRLVKAILFLPARLLGLRSS